MSLNSATDRDVVTVVSAAAKRQRMTSVGGQHLRDSGLDRLRFRLLETTDVENAIEWPKPYDAAFSGAAK